MRVRRILAVATLMALPLGLPAAMAAPATPGTARAVSAIDAKGPVINVRNGGFRGGSGFRSGGGFRAGGFRGHIGGPRIRSFSPGVRNFSRGAYRARAYGGPKFAYKGGYKGGKHHYGNWAWRGHHRRHFRGRYFVGYPYYYGAYYPSYYYDDDYYYDDGGYSDDGVARCAARYRSFDPASGTFLGNDGRRHLCPYLQ